MAIGVSAKKIKHLNFVCAPRNALIIYKNEYTFESLMVGISKINIWMNFRRFVPN